MRNIAGTTLMALTALAVANAQERNDPELGPSVSPKVRPNVILVMTDDQGYGDLAAHGHPFIKTPVLDKLREQSLSLTNFHVDPTCSPTRAALMTGRYSGRVGVWHTILGRSLLRRNETTMADVFKANGYATAMFGKWHLGDNYPYRPQDRGFDTVIWHKGGGVGQGPDFYGNDYFDDTYFVKDQPRKFKGYCTDVWFTEALKFIEANKDKPFFCYLPTNAPHAPFNVDAKYSDPYRGKADKKVAGFLGMITNIDENMGRLIAKLDELNLAKNTILIFMSDNGTQIGDEVYNAGMRGRKGSQYDGGHRVPFFMRWPDGGIPAGDVDTLTAHVDLLPTLIDLCGLNAEDVKYDGASIKNLLYGKRDEGLENRTLIVESQRVYNPEKWRQSSVMTKKWRLIDGKELYDIAQDPGQETDVAGKHADVVEVLRKDYEKFWEELSSYSHKQSSHIVIGAPQENPTTLMSHDKLSPSGKAAWGQGGVRAGVRIKGSYWSVEVEEDGLFTFDVRRWPIEADKALNDKYDGKALTIKSTTLSIGDFKQTIETDGSGKSVTFKTPLKKGIYKLVVDFNCKDGLRGAYYVYAARVSE